jgi:hypothetical protein
MKKGRKDEVQKQMTPNTLEGNAEHALKPEETVKEMELGGQRRVDISWPWDTHINRRCVSTLVTAGCACSAAMRVAPTPRAVRHSAWSPHRPTPSIFL